MQPKPNISFYTNTSNSSSTNPLSSPLAKKSPSNLSTTSTSNRIHKSTKSIKDKPITITSPLSSPTDTITESLLETESKNILNRLNKGLQTDPNGHFIINTKAFQSKPTSTTRDQSTKDIHLHKANSNKLTLYKSIYTLNKPNNKQNNFLLKKKVTLSLGNNSLINVNSNSKSNNNDKHINNISNMMIALYENKIEKRKRILSCEGSSSKSFGVSMNIYNECKRNGNNNNNMRRRNVISGYNGNSKSNNMSMSEKSKYNSKDERNVNNGVKRRHYKAMSYNYEGVNTYGYNSNSNNNNNYINDSNHKKNNSNNYTHNKYIAFNNNTKNAFKQSSHKKLNNNNNNKQKLNKTQIRKSIKLIE